MAYQTATGYCPYVTTQWGFLHRESEAEIDWSFLGSFLGRAIAGWDIYIDIRRKMLRLCVTFWGCALLDCKFWSIWKKIVVHQQFREGSVDGWAEILSQILNSQRTVYVVRNSCFPLRISEPNQISQGVDKLGSLNTVFINFCETAAR